MPVLLVMCVPGIMLCVLSAEVKATHSISVVQGFGALWNNSQLLCCRIVLGLCTTSGVGAVDSCKGAAGQLVLWNTFG